MWRADRANESRVPGTGVPDFGYRRSGFQVQAIRISGAGDYAIILEGVAKSQFSRTAVIFKSGERL